MFVPLNFNNKYRITCSKSLKPKERIHYKPSAYNSRAFCALERILQI